VQYFDCCCEVGPRNQKDPAAPWSTRDVLRWMDHVGIDGALVVHTLSITNDPVDARDRLAREIAAAPGRLFPVWVVLPPDAGDFERDPQELLDAMDAAGVRAVKLFPKSHNYPFALPVLETLLAALEGRSILTLIDYAELPSGPEGAFGALEAVLSRFPALPVLLQRANWSMQRVVTALMERYPNLHLEFSNLQNSRGIEVYAERFGAERLLFGTGLPAMSAGAARAYVDYARVPEEVKRQIAGENLSRLLGGLQPEAAPPRAPDEIRDAAGEGRPLPGVEVWDAHCHILHEGGNGCGPTVMYRGDADGLIEIMDTVGIRRTAIMSWVGPVASDPIEGNEIVARAVEKYPDRFLGVCYINPTHLSRDELLGEVRRRVEEQGFVGLKPYLRTALRYDDDLYAPCWEYGEEHGLYALCHVGGSAGGMDVIAGLAERYPRMNWVVAHSGGSYAMARQVTAAMKERPNIWAELTLTPVTNGVIEWMASEVGDDRILFGTDAPMRDMRPQFGWVIWSDLPAESRRRVLGENFRRLLGR